MPEYAWGGKVEVPLVRDPDFYGRFLFALPILELGSFVVAGSLAAQMRHLLHSGVILDSEKTRFRSSLTEIGQLKDSLSAEVGLVIGAFAIPIIVRLILGLGMGKSSWDSVDMSLTAAGWWYNLVSLPMIYFYVLRRVWIFLVWAWLLVRIAQFDLQLTPTHPDRAGGMGFVGQGLVSFSFLVLAVSAMVSAGLADEIINHGRTLSDLKYHVIFFVVLIVALVHLPLGAFSVRLTRCRARGLLEFEALAWRHDREFDEKWCRERADEEPRSLLGSADVQSLVSVAACYEHVDRMWLIPFDTKSFALLVAAAIIPMIPLVGTEVPLTEIFTKLGELLI